MDAKEYLSKVRAEGIKLEQLRIELAELKSLAASISAVDLSRVTGTTGERNAGFTKAVEKIEKLEKDIDQQFYDFTELKTKVIYQIQGLSNINYAEVLSRRYLQNQGFQKIADDLFYTYRHIIGLHGKALKEFESKYLK